MLQTLPTNAHDLAARAEVLKAELSRKIKRRDLLEHRLLPEVFQPILEPHRYKGLYGGRGSGKSHAFAERLLSRCLEQRIRAVCVREFQVTLEHSVKQLLEDKISFYDIGEDFRILNTHIETPQNGIIIFQGMRSHNAESIKSLEGYDVAWVEEAQTFSETSLKMLRPTLRNPDSELWFSWNPRFQTDPVDDLFRGNAPRIGKSTWASPPDSVTISSTFEQNPHFPEVLQREMLWDRSRDMERYLHVWEGSYETKSESRVFKNWTVEEFETPDDVSFYYGGDWGYSVDPAVLSRCWSQGRKLFIDYEAYQVGCEIDHLGDLFDRVPGARQWPIVADSARPETIGYMKRHGFPQMEAAIKGKDSVKEGVIFLQGYDIVIHPRCKHTIDEFRLYSYKTDPQTGTVVPILEDKKNHVIDAVRYATERLRKGQEWATW